MPDSIIKRNSKGQYPPGVSGNPSGRKKDGSKPVQPSPISDFRDILALGEHNEQVLQMIAPIVGAQLNMLGPIVLQLAVKTMKNDSRILAIMLQHTLNRIDRQEAKKREKAQKNIDQLALEFEEYKSKPEVRGMFETLGLDIDKMNLLELSEHLDILQDPSSLLGMPAQNPENSREKQENEIQKTESTNQKTDD